MLLHLIDGIRAKPSTIMEDAIKTYNAIQWEHSEGPVTTSEQSRKLLAVREANFKNIFSKNKTKGRKK